MSRVFHHGYLIPGPGCCPSLVSSPPPGDQLQSVVLRFKEESKADEWVQHIVGLSIHEKEKKKKEPDSVSELEVFKRICNEMKCKEETKSE